MHLPHLPHTLLTLTLTIFSLHLTHALPLNINLGAYSPALVVGDGAISFEGAEEGEAGQEAAVAQIVNALQGAAIDGAVGVSGASQQAGAGANNAAGNGVVVRPSGVQGAVLDGGDSTTVGTTGEAAGKVLDPRV